MQAVSSLVVPLAACGGGGDEGKDLQTSLLPSKQQRIQLLALQADPYNGVPPVGAVEQLLDWAEVTVPQLLFPHQTTQAAGRFLFRYYSDARVYLGVAVGVQFGDGLVEGGVYILGGSFLVPTYIGHLLDFIIPVNPSAAFAISLHPGYPQFAVSGAVALVRILVDANRTIKAALNGITPWGTIGVTGGIGLSPPMTFSFTPDHVGLLLGFPGTRGTAYTVTFTLEDLAGNVSNTLVVPLVTP